MTVSLRSRIAPFLAMEALKAAAAADREGRNVVHLEVGQPATPAPQAARALLASEIATGRALGYTETLGIAPLREAIAGLYKDRHGIDLDPGRVIVTSGSSGAFILAFLTLFDQGARVAIADPGYPAYRNILSALGCKVVRIETGPETRYQPTPDQIAAAGPLDGVLVASPGNPTGTMLDRAAYAALAQACRDGGIALISDEIYHGISFTGPAVSALEVSDRAFVINSFSKYFSMTGWRVGWMVVPEEMVSVVEPLAQNLFICAAHPAQIAALGALSPEARAELDGHCAVYAENRRLMLEVLPRLGFGGIVPPDGAFYLYADVRSFTNDSQQFCADLLDREAVAATPGMDFDTERGNGTIRFSLARSTEEVREGLRRLGRFLGRDAGL